MRILIVVLLMWGCGGSPTGLKDLSGCGEHDPDELAQMQALVNSKGKQTVEDSYDRYEKSVNPEEVDRLYSRTICLEAILNNK